MDSSFSKRERGKRENPWSLYVRRPYTYSILIGGEEKREAVPVSG